jgi:hypothetical protein
MASERAHAESLRADLEAAEQAFNAASARCSDAIEKRDKARAALRRAKSDKYDAAYARLQKAEAAVEAALNATPAVRVEFERAEARYKHFVWAR